MIDKAFIDVHLEGLNECVKDASNAILEVYKSSDFGEINKQDGSPLTIADKKYDGSDLPDTVKAYVSELVRANQNKTNIEYRLRQLDAARITFINTLKDSVEASGVSPTMDEE